MKTNRPAYSLATFLKHWVATSLSLLAVTSAFANTPAATKVDLAKGQASYAATCAACHGPDGNSAIAANPKLAGQHPQYLVKQMVEFKSGKRANAVMSGMIAAQTPEDMQNMAAWLATQKPTGGTAKEKDLIALGEKIYRGGVADRKIAACSGCHSPNGAGIPAQYPRLAGQQAEYTAAQLTAFREGTRGNNTQMTQVAAKLNNKEIKALADYIAGLK